MRTQSLSSSCNDREPGRSAGLSADWTSLAVRLALEGQAHRRAVTRSRERRAVGPLAFEVGTVASAARDLPASRGGGELHLPAQAQDQRPALRTDRGCAAVGA